MSNITLTEKGREYLLSGKAASGFVEGYPRFRVVEIKKDAVIWALGIVDADDNILFEYTELYALPEGAGVTLKNGEGTEVLLRIKVL